MTTTNIYDMAQTWNNGSTVFTAIKMDVTDTASNAGSLLLDLQVGGTSRFSVVQDSNFSFTGFAGRSIISTTNQSFLLANSSGNIFGVVQNELRLNGVFAFSTNVTSGGFSDLRLYRDAANILAQRNGLNAQEFRLYNTYTDASNYERGYIRWDTNLRIGTEHSGGTSRSITITSGANLFLEWSGGGATGNSSNFYSSTPGAVSLGRGPTPWRDLFLRPSSSLTPTSNGDLCIEATNNTTLTFKLKGSDGTVRSGTVTLA